jgi:predicted DNA binding CopG/RHH family protein
VKPFRWDPDKNERLKVGRGISFEEIVAAVEEDGLKDILVHPNQQRYPGQVVLIVAYRDYIFLVPSVEERTHYFLKTIIPSQKATRDYLGTGETVKKLDRFEREILGAYEKGRLVSARPTKAKFSAFREAARATFAKNKRVNIRLSAADLMDLQARAYEEGVPYQTLIASVLHKYVSGRLRETKSRLMTRSTRTRAKSARPD